MKSSLQMVNTARKLFGSDRKTALSIGCSAQHIYNVRKKHSSLGPYFARKLALKIGIDPDLAAWIALAEASRTREEMLYWSELADKAA